MMTVRKRASLRRDRDPTLGGHAGLRDELELLLTPEEEEFLFKS